MEQYPDVARTLNKYDHCTTLVAARQKEALSTFWDKLPSIFGLPSWAEFHVMRRTAMGEKPVHTSADGGNYLGSLDT
jgi:hypothetical protein